VELILRKNLISTTMLSMLLLMFFFSVVCAWLSSANSHVNYDLKIQHLEKVISRGVNKTIMEHLMKLYREIALG
jgi:uncharacterized membrane protein YciS (DUF1049 family)